MMGERFFCALTVGLAGGALFAVLQQLIEVWA